ncbi:hypothetical protein PFICI_05473 [Pestalotiopsis fici W106-1]|uniref:Aminotransferase class I/classII large domain-containing protein n=1 Tax=Pestalotiopsis fici (strain W106-1 / CGMCC3.15140) TaxID=1229662 RepID=W3XDU5_PESFW|nr:uncharacterized protein PFICI_05473 [Pestalotiopsis fici W106-1]ETS83597.1 hypothetical protein PFICI_05473 [Pestalotiopsis fici W106-1]
MSWKHSFAQIQLQRDESRPLTGGIAPVVDSDMFKSPQCLQKPKSKSMEHFLSVESRARGAATLKAGGAELTEDIISLSTGRPSSEYFPFLNLSLELPKVPRVSESHLHQSTTHAIEKHGLPGSKSLDLAISLNYGYSAGSEQLIRFVTEHVEAIHNPPYSNWHCSLTVGSTAALDAAFRMFCQRGDFILMEKFSYSGAIEAARPLGIQMAGIDMDDDGLSPTHLDNLLSEWDTAQRGARKPFLLYTIPTGHNPCGITQSLQRRREIYAVAEKHDLFIIEDDPYYFMQFNGQQNAPLHATEDSEGLPIAITEPTWDLLPSYLSLDVSGRVLRLDSTSKMLAPGLRCSWMTGNSEIISRLLYYHDVSTVSPSGLSQLVMHTLLNEVWGHEGFMTWLEYLCDEYLQRRDILVRACATHLPSRICSWHVPDGGMFLWIKVAWQQHPSIADAAAGSPGHDEMLAIEDSIYQNAMKRGVMCCKGSAFCVNDQEKDMFFRATFATASFQQMEEAIARFGGAISAEFQLMD